MAVSAGQILRFLEGIAPGRLASEWDNSGLQVGCPEQETERVLVALDADPAVVEEAASIGARLIITHHPLLFKPITSLRTDSPVGTVLAGLVRHGITLLSVHTNLDAVAGGVSDVLAGLFGLEDVRVLQPGPGERLLKLAVFVPTDFLDMVRQAISEAGAGHIGRYSHCTFSSPGTGTFKPLEGATPFIGSRDRLETVEECRLETIVPEDRLDAVIAAMLRAHPYEEVAYDVYRLENGTGGNGIGRYGRLPREMDVNELAGRLPGLLGTGSLKITGPGDRRVRLMAVCGGSGGSLVRRAAEVQADLLLTGDVGYHDAREAAALGLAVIDAGHAATEKPVLPSLVGLLRGEFRDAAEVVLSEVQADPSVMITIPAGAIPTDA